MQQAESHLWRSDYQFYATLASPGGVNIGDVGLNVDWVPALRWAEFQACLAANSPRAATGSAALIEPRWSTASSGPYLENVVVRYDGETRGRAEIPLEYFADAVTRASAQLIESGALAAGDRFEYSIYALPVAQQRVDGRGDDLAIEPVDTLPVVGNASLELRLQGANITTENPGDYPVLVPAGLLHEIDEIGRSVGHVETGGVLLGSVSRDPGGTVFCEATAQIQATHTSATETSLRFTPETWATVQGAIELRGRRETVLGWWHTHPFFCRNCPRERRARCPLSVPAFSAADRQLHREVFQSAWSVALLVSYLGEERPSFDCFVWDRGLIKAGPLHVLPPLCNQQSQ